MGELIYLKDYKIIRERKEVHEKMRREGLELDLQLLDQETDEILKLIKLAKNTASQMNRNADEYPEE